MSIQYDNRISLGHVISIVMVLSTCLLAYATLYVTQQQMAAEIVSIKADAQAREARIRAVEIAQASQSSDLRAIQIGIGRIEAQLEKMQVKP